MPDWILKKNPSETSNTRKTVLWFTTLITMFGGTKVTDINYTVTSHRQCQPSTSPTVYTPPNYNGTIHCNRSVEFSSQDMYVYTNRIMRYSSYNNSSNTLVNPSQVFFYFLFFVLQLFIYTSERKTGKGQFA